VSQPLNFNAASKNLHADGYETKICQKSPVFLGRCIIGKCIEVGNLWTVA